METDRPGMRPSSAKLGSPARRRILKAGAATTPILATLASRPVLGGQCLSTSAAGSVNPSHGITYATCTGGYPSYWTGTAKNSWPSPFTSSSTYFDDTTAPDQTGLNGGPYAGVKMKNVLGGSTTLGAYIGAALLNAYQGLTPVLTANTVREMWNTLNAGQSYQPVPGVYWNASDVIAYLKTTMSQT
jgi:hypothetical protein